MVTKMVTFIVIFLVAFVFTAPDIGPKVKNWHGENEEDNPANNSQGFSHRRRALPMLFEFVEGLASGVELFGGAGGVRGSFFF